MTIPANAIRAFLILAILGGLGVRLSYADNDARNRFDHREAAMRAAAAGGYAVESVPRGLGLPYAATFRFRRDDCDDPTYVTAFKISNDVRESFGMLDYGDVPSAVHYLGGRWDGVDRLGWIWRWASLTAMDAFGLSDYVPSPTAIAVAEPATCVPSLDPIDWASIWRIEA